MLCDKAYPFVCVGFGFVSICFVFAFDVTQFLPASNHFPLLVCVNLM
jgi:hypothetical protein